MNYKLQNRPATLSAKVLKVMSLFSGVQVVTILCSIIRTKLVAIWLGPTGIGLFGLYNSAIETISSVTQLGTGTGVIRALAASPRDMLPKLATVVRRWGIGLGLMGAVATLCLSPWLSKLTFGDDTHTLGFIILSVAILLITLSNNEGAIFQGLKQYGKLAKSTVAGAVVGLAISIPMYYFWGLDSIIPSIMVYVVTTWIFRGLYREKIEKPKEPLSTRETFVMGKEFAVLGLYMTITVFASNAVSYIFMAYLNREGGTEVAGYYQAGFTLVNRYVGVILGAVGMEYLPRLSQVVKSPRRIELFLTHEIILILLVIFPVVTIFISADRLIVELLYDKEFVEQMQPFITWAIIGTVFRAWSWCVAYTILAKNDGAMFLLTELLSAIVAVVLNIVFYNKFGVPGLGYAYTLWYVFYLIEVWVLCRKRYKLRTRPAAVALPLGIFLISCAAALTRQLAGWEWTLPFTLFSLIFSGICLTRLLRRKKDERKNDVSFVQNAKKR